MDWKPELRKLPDIQALDREIDHLRSERRELEAGKAAADLAKRVADGEARLQRVRTEREALARQQRLDDLARQSEETDRKKLNEKLYGGSVRNPRDLEGLQKNIAGSEEKISVLETRILEAMEKDEGLAARVGQLERVLHRDREQLAALRAESTRRIAEIDASLKDLEGRRSALASSVAAPVQREYDRIRGRAGGVGVGVVSGGVCGACGVALPPLLMAKLGHGDTLLTCEHCGRLLVEGD